MKEKLGVVLFNLGGPDSPEAIEPFLRNLFSDPAIIGLPAVLRKPLAWLIARRRAPVANDIYAKMGGRSPILEETERQAGALKKALDGTGQEVEVQVAMRCWHPRSEEAARALKTFAPDRIVLLPLYPQFSTTTSASSFQDWEQAARGAGLSVPSIRICCYPSQEGFITAVADQIRTAMKSPVPGLTYRILFSAHGLPERIVAKGDPYRWQVERTAKALVDRLGIKDLDWAVCYQSRVGPLAWLSPATDAEIRRAGRDGKGVVVVPIAFVSEHSETLVELDIDYRKLAAAAGVKDYRRAPTVSADRGFIEGLAALVRKGVAALDEGKSCISAEDGRICPAAFVRCACENRN